MLPVFGLEQVTLVTTSVELTIVFAGLPYSIIGAPLTFTPLTNILRLIIETPGPTVFGTNAAVVKRQELGEISSVHDVPPLFVTSIAPPIITYPLLTSCIK